MKSFEGEDALLGGIRWIEGTRACSGVYVLDEGKIIVDAGSMFGLVDELLTLGPADRLEKILLTHAHPDHVEGVAEIYQAMVPVLFVHRVAREHLRLQKPPYPEFFDMLEADGRLEYLEDGDEVETGSMGPLQVVHTPGHTAGDLCFFNEPSGALFCGDAVLPSHLREGALLSEPDAGYGGRMEDKRRSLRRLLKVPARHLFPGHGEPVLRRGMDQIKLSLLALHRSLRPDDPEGAWVETGVDLLEAGWTEEARQCALKAGESASRRPELAALLRVST